MSHRSPLSRPLEIALHIGTGKTGTSSIQYFLDANRQRLSELGHLYPETPGRARHGRLGLFIKSDAELEISPNWPRQKESNPAKFRKVFRRELFSEIERSGLSRVLFSDEILYSCSDPALRRLRLFTDRIAKSLRLVVYLRRQDDHMVSRYQQMVKTGEILRLDGWARQDMTRLYDYDARLRLHERLLAPGEFVVRRFEPESFVAGSLHQDFLNAAGVDASVEDMERVPDHNESLDAESVEFLRLMNLHRVENELARVGLINNRRLVARLAEASTGPTLTLPAAFLDRFMEQWGEPNQAVARRHLGDSTGELFRMPRRTHNTTTDQRLDPERLDHFLALAELSEETHAPLRALAEREARTR